ncbi:hypothetical protein QR680_014744 [Steinernema hermaphroditum]|uniref:Peptidase S1 domain-containing protein n=1 Tax=Steinernema hermaphroditum TaxID=289476 RepID=A0AA39I9Z7_9BILA|nr:hypothetical protein QR680_014744 [Steinernema hermaphroditum]
MRILTCVLLFSTFLWHLEGSLFQGGLKTTELVFGGSRARVGQFPSQVYIDFFAKALGQNASCGGTLLSTTHVLTAAHCVVAMGGYKTIMVGDINRRNPSASAQWRGIKHIHTHPKYVHGALPEHNDIAIVELDKPVKLNKNVQLIKIAKNDALLTRKRIAVVSGWGTIGYNGNISLATDYLLYAELSLFSFNACNATYWHALHDTEICAGARNKGAGSGDSGGPLQVTHNGKAYQIGVVSWSLADHDAHQHHQDKYPAVYTRVSSYCDFIERILKKSYCVNI